MKKVYLVYFEWRNTAGNHAGMGYLANKLEADFENVHLIKMISSPIKWFRVFNFFYSIYLAIKFKILLGKNDKVFLMEYMARSCFQDILASSMRFLRCKSEVVGLVHLAGNHLLEIYHSKDVIANKMNKLDRCIVFGSSLKEFLKKEIGFVKVTTTFHYVDNLYYKPNNLSFETPSQLSVLSMGHTKRDFTGLQRLVESLPNVHFDICAGRSDLTNYLGHCKNVTLYGFLDECDLLELMQSNDVGLSVMEDTIGSNVIVTSLSTGMVSVVSDVGSIRDYCTENESFFCKTTEDFQNAISFLSNNLDKIPPLKRKSHKRGQIFSYDNFREEFKKIFDI
jgi:glycosyltransferase involved in cell wall biosynthesis